MTKWITDGEVSGEQWRKKESRGSGGREEKGERCDCRKVKVAGR